MKWGDTFKAVYLEYKLVEGTKRLVYFDHCSPSNNNFIFGVKLFFFFDHIQLTWTHKYKDLAAEIVAAEMSGDFEQMKYVELDGKKYEKINDDFVRALLSSESLECKIYAAPDQIQKASMWVRYLDDVNYRNDNLTDEIIRQKTVY